MKRLTLLVEDEQPAREHLQELIATCAPELQLKHTCTRVDEARHWLSENQADVVFLDINLADASGFDLLDAFPKRDFQVVFVTGYDSYAIRALRIQALDYLLKPVDKASFRASIDRLEKRAGELPPKHESAHVAEPGSTPTSITLYHQKGFSVVPFASILYLKGEDNYTRFFLEDGSSQLVSRTLRAFEDLLTPVGFVRIHKSTMVNPSWICKYHFEHVGEVELTNGVRLEVSRRRSQLLFQAIDQHSIGTKSATRFRA